MALLLLLRFTGQREAGGLGITDVLLVVLVAVILLWSVVVDAIAYRWPALGRFLKARPRLLIRDGEPHPPGARRELMGRVELMSQLRLHGIEDPGEVERAYIEPNGMISVVRRDHGEPDEPVRPDTVE
ncbi:MAG TPA: YetF domain-containing protein [Actinopolymorphaceae bacterium]